MADVNDRDLTPPPKAPAARFTEQREGTSPGLTSFMVGVLYGGALGVIGAYLTWGL